LSVALPAAAGSRRSQLLAAHGQPVAPAIFDYIEIWHNRQRRQSSIGMMTPIEFEAQARTITAA
jgi:transposase InsO family protein